MARLVISEKADLDASDILTYLKREAGAATARKYAAKLDALYDTLTAFPGIGALRPKLGQHARISGVPPYVIIYDYVDDTVTILRIIHGRRHITPALLKH